MPAPEPAVESGDRTAPAPRRRPRLTHMLEYLGILGVGALLTGLPERAGTRLLEALGSLAGAVFRVRRGVVDRNLLLALPDLAVEERDRIATASYRHLVREAGSLVGSTLRPLTKEELLERVQWGDESSRATFQRLEERSSRNEPSIVLTGHLGNWELAGAFCAASGVPVQAVAVDQRNPLFDRRIRSTRQRLGLTLISRDDAMREVPRALRAGATVGLVADQHSHRGVRVDFFGHPVRAARGPAVFALRSGAPAFLAFLVRDRVWPPRYSGFIEPLEFTPVGRPADDVVGWTSAYLAGLERYVRRFPEQYLWLHKRWRE